MLLLCPVVFSQTVTELSKTIDFNDFKAYDFHKKYLLLDGEFSFSNESDSSNKNTNSNLIGDLDYTVYNNTKYRQDYLSMGASASVNYHDRRDGDSRSYDIGASFPGIYATYNSRRYLNDIFFVGYQLAGGANVGLNTGEFMSGETISTNLYSFSAAPSVEIGIGRLDPVSNVEQLIYILEELESESILGREVKHEDLISLASLQNDLNSIYMKDFRLKQRTQLMALDSAFRALGLVEDEDIRYFLTLDDYWKYGYYIPRQSGTRLSLSVEPGFYSFINNSDIDYANTNRGRLYTQAYLNFDYQKFLNLKWHLGARSYVGYTLKKNYDDADFEDFEFYETVNGFSAGIGGWLAYSPDSRTHYHLACSLSGKYDEYVYETEEKLENDEVTPYGNVRLSVYHYLSPRLHIEGNLEYKYNSAYETISNASDYNPLNRFDCFLKLGYWIL